MTDSSYNSSLINSTTNNTPTTWNNTQQTTPWSHLIRLSERARTNSQMSIPQLLLQEGEYLASSGLNGLTQGTIDEIEGGIKGAGYGVTNLGMRALNSLGADIRAPQETFSQAYNRGYITGRDYRRQVLENARENSPVLSTGAEMFGSIVSPANNMFRVSSTAPLSYKATTNLKNSLTTGAASGYGNSNTNELDEVAWNVGKGVMGNLGGHWGADRTLGRGGDPLVRNTIGNTVSYGLQKGLSYFK